MYQFLILGNVGNFKNVFLFKLSNLYQFLILGNVDVIVEVPVENIVEYQFPILGNVERHYISLMTYLTVSIPNIR